MRKLLKGEKHHWWPKGLSKYWGNEQGLVYRKDYSGKIIRSKPKAFGQISDGHNILFDEESPWESTFEDFFDNPDRSMPKIIDWLESLSENLSPSSATQILEDQECPNLDLLREGIISLIIRSPRYRSAQSSFVESFRGELGKSENKTLIAANIHQKYRTLADSSIGIGKFSILYSHDFEFIFGDGFYSNVNAATERLHGLRVVVPMTPQIAVIWCSPMAYRSKPKIVGVHATPETVEEINKSVQVYSKEYLFYRSQEPDLIKDFKVGQHRVYQHEYDPMRALVNKYIPEESSTPLGFR